jgi:acyl-CoA synthetase (AMP-forming)/AMP-acid ligase II
LASRRGPKAAGPDQIRPSQDKTLSAIILFSAGSTDAPKGAIDTRRMLCAKQQAILQVRPFLAEKPPARDHRQGLH